MNADPQLLEQARSTDPDTRQRAAYVVSQSVSERDYPLMFELLGDRDWRVRKTIVDGFVRESNREVIDRLVEALGDDENAGRRNSSIEALMRIGEPAIAPIVARLRNERDVDVRLSLVNLLGDLRNPEGLHVLLQSLEGETDVNVSSATVASIGKYRDSSALPALIAIVRRDDLWLKFHAVEALGEIGDRAALPAILPLYAEKSLRKPVLEAVGKIGDIGTLSFLLKLLAEEEKLSLPALRALIAIARARKPRLVEQAERNLIQRKFRESFPKAKIDPLIQQLRGTSKRDVKMYLLEFLGWSRDDRALLPLIEHLQQPDTAETAAQALIDFGPAAIPMVLDALQVAEEEEVVALLLRVINMVGSAESVPAVVPLLDHHNPMIRRLAIETLGDLLYPAAVEYLLAKLDDPDVASQQAAVNAVIALVNAFPAIKTDVLSKIRRLLQSPAVPLKLNSLSIFVNIQGEGYHNELLLASKDSDPLIRQQAISLMGKFTDEAFADQLVLSLTDESTAVRIGAIQAIVQLRPDKGLQPLIRSLEDDDIWIRTAAAQALGEYRDKEAIEPLVKHAIADVGPARIAAIEAIGKSDAPNARGTLTRCLHDEDAEVRRAAVLALGRLPGPDSIAAISKMLHDRDWRIRAAAVTSLGIRGDRSALQDLQNAVEDPDPYVQQSAVAALDKMPDRSSFGVLLRALDNPAILDDVCEVLIHHKDIYRDLLEQAWKAADRRREVVIAAALTAMKQP
jgi:HEAT repeat protein